MTDERPERHSAAYWRAKADEVRAAALKMNNLEHIAMMFDIAASYDALARTVAERERQDPRAGDGR